MVEFSGRLSRAPVVYALCQIRFAPVLKMKEFLADIQDELRAVYEDFEEEQVTGILVPAGGQPSVQADTRWRFERPDKRAGYVLQNAFLTYHTTAYSDFDEFVPEVLRGFAAVSRAAKVNRVQRIGLRYIDLIEGTNETPVEDFIHPRLHSFGSQLKNVKEELSQYVFKGSTERGTIVLRATRARHDVPLPPDLLPLALQMKRTPSKTTPSLFLDTDHFVPDSKATAVDLEGVIRDLKLPIAHLFKQAITEKALAEWK